MKPMHPEEIFRIIGILQSKPSPAKSENITADDMIRKPMQNQTLKL